MKAFIVRKFVSSGMNYPLVNQEQLRQDQVTSESWSNF